MKATGFKSVAELPCEDRRGVAEPADVIAFLADLERGGALSSFQVQRLLAAWPTLRDDWASSPFFRNVGEHTRAFIDELRIKPRPPAPAPSFVPSSTSPKEPIPHV